MIRILIFMMGLCESVMAISLANPELYFNVGTNYITVSGNAPRYVKDFAALNIGSTLQYQIGELTAFNLQVDAAYAPNRKKILIKRDGEQVRGDSELLTSLYSLNLSYMFSKIDHQEWYIQGGPAMGLYTLDYYSFEKNESDIERINRIMFTNYGARISVKRHNDDTNKFFELAYFYMVQNRLTVIDDSSLDAEALLKDDTIENAVNWGLLFNYGWKLY